MNAPLDLVRAAQLSAAGDVGPLHRSLDMVTRVAENYSVVGLDVPDNLRFMTDYLLAAIEHAGVFPEDDVPPAGGNGRRFFQSAPVPVREVHELPAVGSAVQEVVPMKVDPVVREFVKYHYGRKNRAALYNEMIAARQHGADFDADYIMAALHVIRGGVWVDCVCGWTPEPGDAYCGGCGRSRGIHTMRKEVAHYEALGQRVENDWVAL